MATQYIEFEAPTGLTLTAKLFTAGSDTVAYTASAVVEQTNRKGIYRATFSSVTAGTYQLLALDGTSPVCVWWGYAADTASTYQFGSLVGYVLSTVVTDIAAGVVSTGGLSTAQSAQLSGIYSKVHGVPVVLSSTATNIVNGSPLTIYVGSEHSYSTPLGPVTFNVSNSYNVSGWTPTLKVFGRYDTPDNAVISVAGSWADTGLSTQRVEFTLEETDTDNLSSDSEYSYQVEITCGTNHPYASPKGNVILGSTHS
jgi:hypothetical protein